MILFFLWNLYPCLIQRGDLYEFFISTDFKGRLAKYLSTRVKNSPRRPSHFSLSHCYLDGRETPFVVASWGWMNQGKLQVHPASSCSNRNSSPAVKLREGEMRTVARRFFTLFKNIFCRSAFNCVNLWRGLYFSFDSVTRILKLSLACAYIAIIIHIFGLLNEVPPGRPYKYT